MAYARCHHVQSAWHSLRAAARNTRSHRSRLHLRLRRQLRTCCTPCRCFPVPCTGLGDMATLCQWHSGRNPQAPLHTHTTHSTSNSNVSDSSAATPSATQSTESRPWVCSPHCNETVTTRFDWRHHCDCTSQQLLRLVSWRFSNYQYILIPRHKQLPK